jgi:dolichyl-phosphate-mannose--protein O-mannosyl transferase
VASSLKVQEVLMSECASQWLRQKRETLVNNAFLSQVTCGSVIKLMHERSKYRLHSHEVAYGSGSGQQSVTAFPTGDDSNSYWVSVLSAVVHHF